MKEAAKKETVLVVDDAPDTLEVLQRNLTSRQYRVFTAPGVAEAIQVLDQTPVDLVITDLKMPKGSGLDLVRHVRELENVIQRLVVMTDGPHIEIPDLPPLMRFSAPRANGPNRTLAEVEADYIRNVLAAVGGNKTRAAEILGIDRKTLREKLKMPRLEKEPLRVLKRRAERIEQREREKSLLVIRYSFFDCGLKEIKYCPAIPGKHSRFYRSSPSG